MAQQLETDQVWQEIEKQLFGVLGMVNAQGEARTVGIVYIVRDRKLYIGTQASAWKVRHIEQNPNVSLTIPIHKSIPLMPWFKIPSATITFSGKGRVLSLDEIDPDILKGLYRGMEIDEDLKNATRVIEVRPENDFITYGVGVSLNTMRDPQKARGRAPVE